MIVVQIFVVVIAAVVAVAVVVVVIVVIDVVVIVICALLRVSRGLLGASWRLLRGHGRWRLAQRPAPRGLLAAPEDLWAAPLGRSERGETCRR